MVSTPDRSCYTKLLQFNSEGCCSAPVDEGYITVSVATSHAQEVELLKSQDGLTQQEPVSRELARSEEEEADGKNKEEEATPQMVRPPRSLVMIFAAAFIVGFGVAAGATGAWFLWQWQSDSFGDACLSAPSVVEALHLMQWQNVTAAIYCENIRTSFYVEGAVICGLAVGLGALLLRLSFGKAYFTSWNESEKLGELERLYSVRSYGGTLVLFVWRARVTLTLFFDLVVMLCFRYYLDLYLDILSMKIFWKNEDYWFMLFNLSGIVLGILWTLLDTCISLGKESDIMPTPHILLTGFLMPIGGLHVAYLTMYSLGVGYKHKFLFLSTLAESVLESSISAFVQTYSVVFSDLDETEKITLYQSIGMSFVSIGVAFSSLDKVDGGELLIKVPGYCKGYDKRMIIVIIFRIAEVTSRATSLGLFQLATRPYGLFYLLTADFTALLILCTIWQFQVGRYSGKNPCWFALQQLLYSLPCTVCLMAPVLEKDCVLTVPPIQYYLLRFLELVAMVGAVAWKENWSLRTTYHLFANDALIFITCIASTLLMFILFIIIRSVLVMRVMLEANEDLWFSRAFVDRQIALRNRILARNKRADAVEYDRQEMMDATERIADLIQENPGKFSWEIRKIAKEQDSDIGETATQTVTAWEDMFLRAKVSMSVKKTADTLADAVDKHMGRQASKKSQSASKSISRRDLLKTGLLVQLHDSAHRYVTLIPVENEKKEATCPPFQSGSGKTLRLKMLDESTVQKFVVEPTEPQKSLYETVKSGDQVRLRSLSDGKLLGFIPEEDKGSLASAKHAKEAPKIPELPFKVGIPKTEECVGSQDRIFSVSIAYQHVYRSAYDFKRKVKMEEGHNFKKVKELTYHNSKEPDWQKEGWQIVAVNDEVATKENIDDLFKQGGVVLGAGTPKSGGGTPSEAGDDTSSVGSGDREADRQKGEVTVMFLKEPGTPISLEGWRSKVVLHPAGTDPGWKQDIAVHIPKESDTNTNDFLKAEVKTGEPGSVLCVERAEYDNKGDSLVYRWAGDFIHTQHDAIALKASLAEKYRMAVVAGFNARTLVDVQDGKDSGGGCCQGCAQDVLKDVAGILHSNRDLHKSLLNNLSYCLREEKIVSYDVEDEDEDYTEYFTLKLREDGAIIVGHIDDADSEMLGLQVDDELIELEMDDEGLSPTNDDMIALLNLGPRSTSQQPIISRTIIRMNFRCSEKASIDNDVVKMAAQQASSIAPILPSWEEILVNQESNKMNLLKTNNFFEMKCTLVTSLLKNGWDIYHQDFCDSALKLHNFFCAVDEDFLLKHNRDVQRENLTDALLIFDQTQLEATLVLQLDVLTASWESVPKIVKEQRADVIKSLFWPEKKGAGIELKAMRDAVEILYSRWRPEANNQKSNPKATSTNLRASSKRMPEPLKRFFMRVYSESDTDASHANSISWLRRALLAKKDTNSTEIDAILKRFNTIHQQAKSYWESQLKNAADRMESANQALEQYQETSQVLLVEGQKQLQTVKDSLDPKELFLKKDVKIGEIVIKEGRYLLREGDVEEMFPSNQDSTVENDVVHQRFLELWQSGHGLVSLSFSTNGFKQKQDEVIKARKDLEAIIPTVRHAAEAFPALKKEYERISETMHKAEGRMMEQVNKRKLKLKQQEAQTALAEARAKFKTVARERDDLKLEKRALQTDKQDLEARNEAFDAANKKLETDKEKLEEDKKNLEANNEAFDAANKKLQADKKNLEEDKKNLEANNEKLTKDREELQGQKTQLQEANGLLEQKRAAIENQKAKVEEERAKLQEETEEQQKVLQDIKDGLAQTSSDEKAGGDAPLADMVNGLLSRVRWK